MCVLHLIISSFELGVSLLTVLCIKCVETRYRPKHTAQCPFRYRMCSFFSFFGRRIFCTESAILRQWVSESDSPVQPSVGREGEEQEKLTFIILKKVK